MFDTLRKKIFAPKPLVSELEFRSDEGKFLFGIKGEWANSLYLQLLKKPELSKTTKNLNGTNYIVFLCLVDCGWDLRDILEVVLTKDSYIKIIT